MGVRGGRPGVGYIKFVIVGLIKAANDEPSAICHCVYQIVRACGIENFVPPTANTISIMLSKTQTEDLLDSILKITSQSE